MVSDSFTLYVLYVVLSVQALKDTGMHQLRMLSIITRITMILFLPLWLFVDVIRIAEDDAVVCQGIHLHTHILHTYEV